MKILDLFTRLTDTMKIKLTLAVLMTLALTTTAIGQTRYYLQFDQNCMNRLEYAYDKTTPGNEFVTYQINLGNQKSILLITGLEQRASQQSARPDNLLACGTSQFNQLVNESLVDAIKSKVAEVYMVLPANNNQYKVAAVQDVSYQAVENKVLRVESSQFRFTYDLNGSTRSGDLSGNDVKGRIYYVGNFTEGPCEGVILRQVYANPKNYLDLYVIPQVGVVKEQSSNSSTTYELVRVNGMDASTYIPQNCGGNSMSNRGSTQPQGMPESYNSMGSQFSSKGANLSREEIKQYLVSNKETLWSIAQKHGINVNNLKDWNNLSSNVIRPGQSLRLTPPGQESNEMTSKSGASPSTFSQSGERAWRTTNGFHIVQSGETVEQLAQKYGYLEERFRDLNNLQPGQTIYSGMKLRTTDAAPQQSPYFNTNQPGSSPQNSGGYQDPYSGNYQPQNSYYNQYQEQYKTTNPNTTSGQQESQKVPAPYNYQNYGPVPGSYNNNQPQNSNPSGWNNNYYSNPNTTTKGAVPPSNYNVAPSSTSPSNPSAPYGFSPTGVYNKEQGQGLQSRGVPASYNYSSGSSNAGRTQVTVQEGETLSQIAQRFGLTQDQLRQLNRLEKNEIVLPYQKIYIN